MLNILLIDNEKISVHTLSKYHSNGSSDVFLPIKLNCVKISLPFFSREQDADNIFSDIQLPGGSLLTFLQRSTTFSYTFYLLKK